MRSQRNTMETETITVETLKKTAQKMRRDIIRMIHKAGSGHPGGSLSAVEILAILHKKYLKLDPKNPTWEKRDRFVLSKGHSAPALYAILAQLGFFPREELLTLRKIGSRLQGHPVISTHKDKVPGIEFSTGPLGQGFSAACGMAKSFKIDGKDNKVFALLGDGECQEGQIWEAAMFATHYKLDNLVAIVDNNDLQIDGRVSEVMSIMPIVDKWKGFGWYVQEVDGHNFEQLDSALRKAVDMKVKPSMIIAKTIKGKGVSFKEDKAEWHGKAPDDEQARLALLELMERCD
jgi:transketolase